MRLMRLEARTEPRSFLAFVETDSCQIVQVELTIVEDFSGCELTDSLDAFELQFPLKAKMLCGAACDVVQGIRMLPATL